MPYNSKSGRVNYATRSYCSKCAKNLEKCINCPDCGWKVRNHGRFRSGKKVYKRY